MQSSITGFLRILLVKTDYFAPFLPNYLHKICSFVLFLDDIELMPFFPNAGELMDTMKLTNRLQKLLATFHAARPEVFADRAVLVTQAYAETEGRLFIGLESSIQRGYDALIL